VSLFKDIANIAICSVLIMLQESSVPAKAVRDEEPAGPFGSREIVALRALWKVRCLSNVRNTQIATPNHLIIVFEQRLGCPDEGAPLTFQGENI